MLDAGAYGTTTEGGNIGTLSIQTTGAGQLHAQIDVEDGARRGQSQIARYSVPAGKTALIRGFYLDTDSGKSAELAFMQRRDFLTVAAPFTAPRLLYQAIGLSGPLGLQTKTPVEIPGETDLWWSGIATGAGDDVTVDFELNLVA